MSGNLKQNKKVHKNNKAVHAESNTIMIAANIPVLSVTSGFCLGLLDP
jgi:hypothetical protein